MAIELEGVEESPGVKEGGVLDQPTREVNIEALPTDIPERIVVSVDAHGHGRHAHPRRRPAPRRASSSSTTPEETTIASVVVPTKVEEPEIEEETELVGEDGEPIEGEPAEGEEGAEAEAAEADADVGRLRRRRVGSRAHGALPSPPRRRWRQG